MTISTVVTSDRVVPIKVAVRRAQAEKLRQLGAFGGIVLHSFMVIG